jgi:hypothetical protein
MDFEYDRSDVLSVVWLARADGELRPPPDADVLDSLVRAYTIVDCAGQSDVEDEAARHPNGCTVIVMPNLPERDACARDGAGSPRGTTPRSAFMSLGAACARRATTDTAPGGWVSHSGSTW